MNIAEKRLPSAIPITGRRFIHVSEQCIVCCIAFRLLYIVLLYLFTIMLLYVILILDCVGYFHRPKKPLIQSHYTHISECFLLARLRRRINNYILLFLTTSLKSINISGKTHGVNDTVKISAGKMYTKIF